MTISATTQGLRMGVATSTSRPTVPFDGQVISETDTDSLKVYNGSAWLGVGKVAQIVTARTATNADNATSTFADTGLSATITPTSNTSTILVMVNQGGIHKTNTNTGTGCSLKLVRNATDLITWAAYLAYTATNLALFIGSASMDYLDSPATTSATTYKTQFMSTTNVSSVSVQAQSTVSSITLMEILA